MIPLYDTKKHHHHHNLNMKFYGTRGEKTLSILLKSNFGKDFKNVMHFVLCDLFVHSQHVILVHFVDF